MGPRNRAPSRSRKVDRENRDAAVVADRAEIAELDSVFQSVARYFGVLSEPTRLKILHAICNAERSVGEIVDATGATQTNVSRHLALMLQVGVVSRRREGTSVFYKVVDPEFADMCRSVCVRIAGRIEAGEPLRRDLLDFAGQR
jgi:DNA-binding transcriptional ArsR family regulator